MNELIQWFRAQDHTTQVLLAFWGSWAAITAVVGVLSFVAWLVKVSRRGVKYGRPEMSKRLHTPNVP
ncbi:MAG: hypothetical protein KDD43_00190, partial [Bdellovibrionales bacterium]|nr:hypothetical protein [Bdellovibrionales bacterium]